MRVWYAAKMIKMENLEQQILDTWYLNHQTNVLLMDSLTEESLGFTTAPRGGGKIGHQLAHMYNIRFWKLESMDKKMVAGMRSVKASDEKSLPMLKDLHAKSAEWIAEILQRGLANDGQLKGFKRGVVPFMGSFIHHEAHHRGNILLTLKRSGFKLPDALKYGIWAWNTL